MPSTEAIKAAVSKLPTTFRIKGFAVGRVVYRNTKIIDETFARNHNWGCLCSGATRLAEDLWKNAGCTDEVAEYLAPTLAEYILQHLPDNFDVKIKLKALMGDVLKTKSPSDKLYSLYVVVVSSDTPVIVEVDKASFRPMGEDTTTVTPAQEVSTFIETDYGKQRTDVSKKVLDALKELRGEDETKPDS